MPVPTLIILTNGDDKFFGKGFDEIVFGLDGDDLIESVSGNDILNGGDGNDTLWGGDDDDQLFGGNDDDWLMGGDGADHLDGGSGSDWADYSVPFKVTGGIFVDLEANIGKDGEADGDTFASIENIAGSPWNDELYGDKADNHLIGGLSSDYLEGRGGDDTLWGGSGDDTLIGGPGADIMAGGKGDDLYEVDIAADVVDEKPGEGIDTVRTYVPFSIAGTGLENVWLLGFANIGATGNAEDNEMHGNGGSNTFLGGRGDDTYFLQNREDIVYEPTNGGNDKIVSTVSYTLGANVERLELNGLADIYGIGNSGDNVISGNRGINLLAGGAGHDGYAVQNEKDVVVETPGSDYDEIWSSVTYTLPDNVEKLTLTGDADIDGSGNGLSNELTGNSGSNVLRGGGGDDGYFYDDLNDKIIELANEGDDLVLSSVSYTLPDNVEDLALRNDSSAAVATGNDLDNQITGNNEDNALSGRGGKDTITGGEGIDSLYGDAGADTMSGGADADVFVYASGAESANADEDTILDFDDNGDDLIGLTGVYTGKLSFIGTAAFTAAGQVRINDIAGVDIEIEVNLAGPGTAEMSIRLADTTAASITAADFLL